MPPVRPLSRSFDSTALQIFCGYYPKGRNFLVTPSADPAYSKAFGNIEVRVCTPSELHPVTMPLVLTNHGTQVAWPTITSFYNLSVLFPI